MAERKGSPDLTELVTRPLDLAARNVRAAAAVAPARPAYAAGFRAAIATVVPLFVAQALALTGGTWMSLAGFRRAPAFASALGRTGHTTAGGAWAALAALVLWPIRPYRPARLAIADCFRQLADYVGQIVDPLERARTGDDALPAGSLVVRAALEQ